MVVMLKQPNLPNSRSWLLLGRRYTTQQPLDGAKGDEETGWNTRNAAPKGAGKEFWVFANWWFRMIFRETASATSSFLNISDMFASKNHFQDQGEWVEKV